MEIVCHFYRTTIIKNKEGLVRYLNNSSNYYDEVTEFVSSNKKLRDRLKHELEETLKNKVKEFGEAFLSEYIASNVYVAIKSFLLYTDDNDLEMNGLSLAEYIIENIKKNHNTALLEKCYENALSSLNQPSFNDIKGRKLQKFLAAVGLSCATGFSWIDLLTNNNEIEIQKASIGCLSNVLSNMVTNMPHSYWEDIIMQIEKEFVSNLLTLKFYSDAMKEIIHKIDYELVKRLNNEE